MCFYSLKFPFVLGLCLCLFACVDQNGKKEKPELLVRHVFNSRLPSELEDPSSRADILDDKYYVYNYQESDLPLFIKMVDTLTFDKTYAFHNHFFIQYDESLPDTVLLKDNTHTYPGIQLGHEESRKYAIIEFTYIKGAIIPGNDISQVRILPDYYKLSVFESGERKRRYFLKDSILGKLNEVDRELLFPDSGIREVN